VQLGGKFQGRTSISVLGTRDSSADQDKGRIPDGAGHRGARGSNILASGGLREGGGMRRCGKAGERLKHGKGGKRMPLLRIGPKKNNQKEERFKKNSK